MRKMTRRTRKRSYRSAKRVLAAKRAASGSEKNEPNDAKDKYGETGTYGKQSEDAESRFSLPRFGWRLDNAPVLAFGHGEVPSVDLDPSRYALIRSFFTAVTGAHPPNRCEMRT
jgi:hypothetical protein